MVWIKVNCCATLPFFLLPPNHENIILCWHFTFKISNEKTALDQKLLKIIAHVFDRLIVFRVTNLREPSIFFKLAGDILKAISQSQFTFLYWMHNASISSIAILIKPSSSSSSSSSSPSSSSLSSSPSPPSSILTVICWKD